MFECLGDDVDIRMLKFMIFIWRNFHKYAGLFDFIMIWYLWLNSLIFTFTSFPPKIVLINLSAIYAKHRRPNERERKRDGERESFQPTPITGWSESLAWNTETEHSLLVRYIYSLCRNIGKNTCIFGINNKPYLLSKDQSYLLLGTLSISGYKKGTNLVNM